MGGELIQAMAQIAEGKASRSTALQPLLWTTSMLSLTFVGSLMKETPGWARVFLATALGVCVAMTFVAYWVAFNRDPDLLRSERFVIRKLEIQQAAMGDDITGEIEPPPNEPPPTLDGGTS